MIKPSNILWKCVVCGGYTTKLHEVFYGSADRLIAIENSVQVPVCIMHHSTAHGVTSSTRPGIIDTYLFDSYNKEQCQEFFCKKLGIDYEKTLRGFEDLSRVYLESIKDRCFKKIMILWIA